MKNKKGFTLIELLAVIIILAIIALITIPIILNMISNSKKKAAIDSAYGYIDAINYTNDLASMKHDYNDMSYESITDGEKNVSDINSTVKMKGKKPTKGTVTITNGKVTYARLAIDGYWVEYSGKEASIIGTYTPGKVTITFKNGETTVETRQINEGSQIGSFPSLTLEEGQSVEGWYTEQEFTNEVETTTTISDNIILYVNITGPRTCAEFSSDSWATIAQNTYPVGCEKEVAIESNSYTVRISNTSTPAVCSTSGYSQTACGFVIEFVDIVEMRKMSDSTSAGGWKETPMVTYLNGDFYNSLPSDLRNVIIPTYPIVSGSGSGGVSDNITSTDTTKNKIYLLSTREVGFDASYDNKRDETTDTRILDYYNTNNNNNSRIKKDLNNTAQIWWLRSARSNTSVSFCIVAASGSYSNNSAGNTRGVAPAFRVGTN